MAVAIAPWSIVVTPGKPEVFIPQGDLQIKNAALPDELEDDAARTSLKLTYLSLASLDDDEDDDDEEDEDDDKAQGVAVTTVLCSLTPGKIEQSSCEIILEQDMEYIFDAVGKNTIHLYGNYIDQTPVDQPPLGSDVDSEEDEEDDYDLNEVSSDVEVPVDVHEAALDDEDDDADRFEEIHEEEESPKTLKRPRDDAMDIDEHEEKLSKSQRKKLAKKLKGADGKPVPAPEPEKEAEEKAEKKGKGEKKEKVEKKEKAEKKEKSEKKEKKDKTEKKDGEGQEKEDKKDGEKKAKGDPFRILEGDVKVRDAKVGSGQMAKKGDKLEIRYIGKFLDGKIFDKNTSGRPFKFTLGQGDVIKGWDIGVAGMQIGGEREFIVPPSLGYGNKKMADIPPNSTLKFEVKLLKIK